MPHLLIAGATGSGKSVCINTMITSILYMARPDEVKLLMIDPKVVELSVYNGIPHLLIPVVTDPKKANGALSWAVAEMDNRYNLFAESGCRDLKGYNRNKIEEGEPPLPNIVIIIDELADLMMMAKSEVEESICRLAQKARAAGLHLIVATQRPSVDVITGLIKANIPSRLAFAVSSGIDSRTVLDMYGAEKLLGKGDMLFLPMGRNKPIRVQGCFISEKEVEAVVNFLRSQAPIEHSPEMIEQVTSPAARLAVGGDVDEFFHEAVEFLLTKGRGSTSMLQRQFRIGYNRASRLMEDLEKRGIVGPEDGVKPRKVTITRSEFREIYGDE
jgi:S-DNA-T family DNA segregation ATPase FtsK/SpoIIIE